MQKLNARIVSFFLILAFSQKLGLELWLHNWLHETPITSSVRLAQKGKPLYQHQVIKCNCIDDVMMPLMESDIVDYSPGQRPSVLIFAAAFVSALSIDKAYSSLRGPPAAGFSI